MLFMIHCLDRADAGATRPDVRPAHLAYLADFQEAIRLAGPLLDDDGNPEGSLYIVDMADRATVRSFLEDEPYARAGLFRSVTIQRWRKVIVRTFPD